MCRSHHESHCQRRDARLQDAVSRMGEHVGGDLTPNWRRCQIRRLPRLPPVTIVSVSRSGASCAAEASPRTPTRVSCCSGPEGSGPRRKHGAAYYAAAERPGPDSCAQDRSARPTPVDRFQSLTLSIFAKSAAPRGSARRWSNRGPRPRVRRILSYSATPRASHRNANSRSPSAS